MEGYISMKEYISMEQIIYNQSLIAMKIVIGLIIAVSIGQVIYRIIKKKKSFIIWLFIGILAPFMIPAFLSNELTKILSREMFGGNYISFIGGLLLFGITGAIISILYAYLVSLIDHKKL